MLRATMTLALLSALASATAARAAVTPVMLAPHAAIAAVTQDRVLVGVNVGYGAHLLSAPAAGGAVATPLLRRGDASHPARWKGLAARGGHAVAEIATQDLGSEAPPLRTEVFTAPAPDAPFAPLLTREKGDPLGAPYDPLVDDTTSLIVGELDPDRRTVVAYPGGQPAQPVPLPVGALPAAVAGGHLAALAPPAGATADAAFTRIVVVDWRTGSLERSFEIGDDPLVFETDIDVRADGAVAWAAIEDGASHLHVALPGAPERVVLTPPGDGGGMQARFAGDEVAWIQYDHHGRRQIVAVPAAGGTPHRIGPLARAIDHLSADGSRLAWIADDCAVSASILDGALPGLPAGPCPRTLPALPDAQTTDVGAAPRAVSVVVRCTAGPANGCAGDITLAGRAGPVGRARFTGVPVLGQRRVTVRLSAGGRARVARALARHHHTAGLLVRAVGIDPQGHRSRTASGDLLLMRRGSGTLNALSAHARQPSEVPSDVERPRASSRYAG